MRIAMTVFARRIPALGAAALVALAAPRAAAGQARAPAPGVVQCGRCHANLDFIQGKGGGRIPDSLLFVAPDALAGTAHAALRCTDCHRGYDVGYPHPTGPVVAPCQTCHAAEGDDWSASIHAANARTQGDAPTCVACHGSHRVYRTSDPRSPTYHLNVASLCGRCHGDQRIIGKYFKGPGDGEARVAAIEFPKSVHGAALTRDGLVVSATCTDCHRAHLVLPPDSARSSVNRANIPATCGRCHAGVAAVFDSSAHGAAYPASPRAVAAGVHRPVCSDCHSAHAIVRADQPRWLLGVVATCGGCHQRQYETYFETYHGQVTKLGFGLVAKCSDCHTAHNMRPVIDPASSVNPMNVVATCRSCHTAANANFTRYYAHPDPTDRRDYPRLFWPWLFMTLLLVSVMGFFLLHTALWLTRIAIERKRGGRPAGAEAAP